MTTDDKIVEKVPVIKDNDQSRAATFIILASVFAMLLFVVLMVMCL